MTTKGPYFDDMKLSQLTDMCLFMELVSKAHDIYWTFLSDFLNI